MLYAELTTVSSVLKHLPESDRNRFSPAGWDAWMKWADAYYGDEMRKFDPYMTHDFCEYESASEALTNLGVDSSDVDLDDEDACMQFLKMAEADSGHALELNYDVVQVLRTTAGSVLVWSE